MPNIPPAGTSGLNNEGFAVGTQAQCVNGFKPAFWADDGNTGGNAIRRSTVPCSVAFLTALASQILPGATAPAATPTQAPGGVAPVVPAIPPFPYVFQNPGALAAISGPNRPATPRPASVAPSAANAPGAVLPIVITPPSTGDAGLATTYGSFWKRAWS